MARLFKYTKEEIIKKAFDLVNEEGLEALTARRLGQKLSSSSKVIFGSFKDMEELKSSLLSYAYDVFGKYVVDAFDQGNEKSYITSGLTYIKLAKKMPNIFKLIYMRDTKKYPYTPSESDDFIIHYIAEKSQLSLEEAKEVDDKYWLFMHGIATGIAYNFLELDDEYIKQALKENYESLVRTIKERKK